MAIDIQFLRLAEVNGFVDESNLIDLRLLNSFDYYYNYCS